MGSAGEGPCYGLTCVPRNSHVEGPVPSTAGRDYTWRWGLYTGDLGKSGPQGQALIHSG